MTIILRRTSVALFTAVFAGVLLYLPQPSQASPLPGGTGPAAATSQQDALALRDAQARLNKSQFNGVRVSVENGIATLTGTVKLYIYKEDAQKRTIHAHGVSAVRNLIEVSGPSISDKALQAQLADALSYDRVGYGNAFNAISVSVRDGVVTVGGHARTYVDRDSALDLISTTPGVRDVRGQIEVDPVSIMDDQIRIAVARAIYGFPTLSKYAINPARPIRISVQNGHVELYGVVDSESDKNTAFLRANSVPGVFGVKNYLQVAGESSEARK
ncbi:MAG TPA: BON domain-containing protein [Terracidiphilus sp.]|nr:BON domain-containing protein [Terracidiphilus sp.]